MSVSYHNVLESGDGFECWVNARWTYQRPDGTEGVQEFAEYAKVQDGLIVVDHAFGDLSAIMGY